MSSFKNNPKDEVRSAGQNVAAEIGVTMDDSTERLNEIKIGRCPPDFHENEIDAAYSLLQLASFATSEPTVKLKKNKSDGVKNKKDQEGHTSVKKGDGKMKKNEVSEGAHHKHTKKKNSLHEAVMNAKRKKLWIAIGKKEIGRTQKQIFAAHKETLTTAKKLALACQREVRKSALMSQKIVNVSGRARRLTKEMLLYWKRYEKVERKHRRRAEKEAQEQLRLDIELREAKPQQTKLNFLTTQTELYPHFMSRKINGLQSRASKLDEPEKETEAPSNSFLKDDDNYGMEGRHTHMRSISLKRDKKKKNNVHRQNSLTLLSDGNEDNTDEDDLSECATQPLKVWKRYSLLQGSGVNMIEKSEEKECGAIRKSRQYCD